jgi:nucleoside-diphosphate-sugar epimerase
MFPRYLFIRPDPADESHSWAPISSSRSVSKLARFGQQPATVPEWGSGTPRREFLHVDDLADAWVFLMNAYSSPEIVNVGWGEDVSIAELEVMIKDVVGVEGEIVFDPSKPGGTPRKLLDTGRLRRLGWRPSIRLEEGVASTYLNGSCSTEIWSAAARG